MIIAVIQSVLICIIIYISVNKIEKTIKQEVANDLAKMEDRSKREIEAMKANVAINDRYIEQLHTKISELEVTLQNFVNKN
jgi:hypothetical protein